MTTSDIQETANYWQVNDLEAMELLHARYITHTFDRHVHDGYALGVIEYGTEAFYYRGNRQVIAPAGSIVAVNPGEIHTGYALEAVGWQYRMFYPSITLMQRIAEELTETKWDTPCFADPVIGDKELASMLHSLHQILQFSTSLMERQTYIREVFGTMLIRYAGNAISPSQIGYERHVVKVVRDYLEAHLQENTSLDDLANLVGFSPYYLLRLFRKQTGMPPHTYRSYLRLNKAKASLAQGADIADIAQQLGYTDQSHFTRRFKGAVGVSPGEYVRQLR